MVKVQTKTLSLLYHAKEDRMILLINKDDVDRMTYWITRRFYFSMLFELDTYLENVGIDNKSAPVEGMMSKTKTSIEKDSGAKRNASIANVPVNNKTDMIDRFHEGHYLLETINLSSTADKQRFTLHFKTKTTLSETIMSKKDFINFYDLMKKSFPKGEWGNYMV